MQSTIAEVDQQSEAETHDSQGRDGLAMLAQMNGDLEALIRNVHSRIVLEQKAAADQ